MGDCRWEMGDGRWKMGYSRPKMKDGNLAINHLFTMRKKCTDLGPRASTRGE